MSIIEIENLSHRFADGTIALKDVSLTVESGSLIVIAGCNGSGKTTLLKHINGLITPQFGNVRVANVDVRKYPEKAHRTAGMVFQDSDSQIVGETVYADTAFGPENMKFSRQEIHRRVTHALAAVGLSELAEQPPHLLSGGEKRRLSIAGVLSMQPKIIMFDEPFSNLDYPGVQQVLQQMVRLKQTGHTLVITTHELEKVLNIADRLIILSNGKIVADGLPQEINRQVERYGVRKACNTCALEGQWLN